MARGPRQKTFTPKVRILEDEDPGKVKRPFRIDHPRPDPDDFINRAWINRLLNTRTELSGGLKDYLRKLLLSDEFAFSDVSAFIRGLGDMDPDDLDRKAIRKLFREAFPAEKEPPDDEENKEAPSYQDIANRWALGRDPKAMQEFLKAAKANDFSSQEANNFGRFLSAGMAEGFGLFNDGYEFGEGVEAFNKEGAGLFGIGLEGIKQGYNMAGAWNSPSATQIFDPRVANGLTSAKWFETFGNKLGRFPVEDPPTDDEKAPLPNETRPPSGVRPPAGPSSMAAPAPLQAPLSPLTARMAAVQPLSQMFAPQLGGQQPVAARPAFQPSSPLDAMRAFQGMQSPQGGQQPQVGGNNQAPSLSSLFGQQAGTAKQPVTIGPSAWPRGPFG